jgi:hypothetical protein
MLCKHLLPGLVFALLCEINCIINREINIDNYSTIEIGMYSGSHEPSNLQLV